MRNLLNAEWYKLRKNLCFKLMAALSVLMTFAQFGLNALMEDALGQISILDTLHSMFANTNAIIFVTVFVSFFVLNDYSSGMVTNFVGKGYQRKEVFLAKFFLAEFGAVLLYLLTALAILLFGILFKGTGEIDAGFFRDFGDYLALQLLYLTAYTAVIVFACTLARNMAAGILISVLGIMLFASVIMQGLELICAGVSRYWIGTIIARCPVRDIPRRIVTESGIVTAFWLVAAMVAGMIWFEKRDVR